MRNYSWRNTLCEESGNVSSKDASSDLLQIIRKKYPVPSKEKTIDDKLRNIERKEESISQKEQNLTTGCLH